MGSQGQPTAPRTQPCASLLLAIWLLAAILLVPPIADLTTAEAQNDEGVVYVASITGTIDLGLAPYLERVIGDAEDAGASALILDINTPGGRLDAVLQMNDALLDADVRTIAFVNRTAFSAGALIAISAHEIYMVPGAVMGAATPVDGAGDTASEKVISAVRSTFRATAEVRGRNPDVAEAMVDPAVTIDGLDTSTRLLTLTTDEAIAWGYADGVVANQDELLQATGLAGLRIEETSPGLAERVVRFVTNPVVASLLIIGGVLLIVGDLFVGGLGALGAAGLAMLALFFWGHNLAGLAGWEDIALVIAGLILVTIEALVIPGFGIPGILGLAALAGGFWLAMVSGGARTPESTERAGWTVALSMIAIVVGAVVILKLTPRFGRAGGLVLTTSLGDEPGSPRRGPGRWLTVFGGGRELELPSERTGSQLPSVYSLPLAGATGTAISDLRPTGLAELNGYQIDVVTDGEYIDAGEAIVVVKDEKYRRVVRRLEATPSAPA
jgi:membrane-bound serine protease (ClpP class)